jgi:hypothetical protein
MSQQRAIHSFFSSAPANSPNLSASPVLPCSQLTQAQLERIQKQKEEALRRRAQMMSMELESGSSVSSLGPVQQTCPSLSSTMATSLVIISCLYSSIQFAIPKNLIVSIIIANLYTRNSNNHSYFDRLSVY